MGASALTVNQNLFKTVPYDTEKDFAPISLLVTAPLVLVVNPKLPVRTLQEFLTKYKNAGDLSYASGGTGTMLHLAGEVLTAKSGLAMRHVPYRGGGPALTALLGKQVDMIPSAPGPLQPHLEAGTVRVLASWGAERTRNLPNLPTFRELGYADVEFYIWAGLFAPKNTPDDIVRRLRDATREAMQQREVTTVFETAGSPPAYLDQPEFARFIEADAARLIPAVKKIGRVE
jgi:tripartite-type tricarboxylate transporter receptor subunit TctC